MIVRLELNSSEKVILCTGETSTTYKLSDISLECNAIFDKIYATTIGQMYTGTTSIPYTKVELIHYQTSSKKDTIWKIDVNNLSVRSVRGLLLLFFDKWNDFANKNEEFYKPNIKKILVTINGMPHHLFAAGLQAREKSGILFQIEKVPETSNGDLTCYVFSLEDALAHLSVTFPSGILTTEK